MLAVSAPFYSRSSLVSEGRCRFGDSELRVRLEWGRMAPRRSRSPIEADKSPPEAAQQRRVGDEWVWGWDPTPGIVSVWADNDGRAVVFRRIPNTGKLVREEDRFRPWLVVAQLTD